MNNAFIQQSQQLYAFLLRLYPKRFRREFGQEMQYVFTENLTEAYAVSGEQGAISVWFRTLLDIGKSSITQHILNQKEGTFMKNKNSSVILQRSALRIAVVTVGILMIPVIGMQVSSGWDWKLFDFAIIGGLIITIGTMIETVNHKVRNTAQKIALMFAFLLLGLYIWVELAVGVFFG